MEDVARDAECAELLDPIGARGNGDREAGQEGGHPVEAMVELQPAAGVHVDAKSGCVPCSKKKEHGTKNLDRSVEKSREVIHVCGAPC